MPSPLLLAQGPPSSRIIPSKQANTDIMQQVYACNDEDNDPSWARISHTTQSIHEMTVTVHFTTLWDPRVARQCINTGLAAEHHMPQISNA
jgi:hypothetical protein